MGLILEARGNVAAEMRSQSFKLYAEDNDGEGMVEYSWHDYLDLVKMIKEIKPYYEEAMEKE